MVKRQVNQDQTKPETRYQVFYVISSIIFSKQIKLQTQATKKVENLQFILHITVKTGKENPRATCWQ